MRIYPAIDLREGRVVRLQQGDYDRMTVYGEDPVQTARGFLAQGATCLHAVDLDGARDGSPQNREVIAALGALPLFLQVGGGMRTEADVERTLSLGVHRAILGTVAVTDFAFTARMGKRYGERIAVGVDARDGLVATHGWKTLTDVASFDFCQRLMDVGIHTVIYTDISRDGLLAGTNLPAYERLAQLAGLEIIASGGISSESEITALRTLGVQGAIVGKALYAGLLSLPRVLALAEGEEPTC